MKRPRTVDFATKLSDSKIIQFPFAHASIDCPFDEEFTANLRAQVLMQPFQLKSNDLYEFYQSKDLIGSKKPLVREFVDTIYSTETVAAMSALFGIELSGTVDFSAHRYPTDGYLLCHDDDIGSESDGRRIAFIFYLVEADWGQKDGGDLSLFDCDVNGDPDSIATSIRPVRGQFSFFQVSGTSHHQVEQVVGSRERVSISGWFHGPKQVGIPAPFGQDGDCVPILSEWINPAYLKNSNMQMIQSKMARDSFLQLQMFLDTALYDALVKAMEQTEFDRLDGPANQRRSHSPSLVLCKNDILSEFKHFISCKPFLWFLQQVTSLELVHSRAQITAFMPGDYTLMNDKTVLPPGLDVLFSMPRNTSKWQDEWGGGTHYVAEQETLLSVYPQTNTLNIVLRDADTLRFVKLVSKTCPAQRVDVDLTLLLAQE